MKLQNFMSPKVAGSSPQTQDRVPCLLLCSCSPKPPDPSWTYLGNWEGAELGPATWSCLPAPHPWWTASSKSKSQLDMQCTREPSWPLLLVQVACGRLPRQLPFIEWVFPAVHYSAQDASALCRAGHSGEMRRLGNCAREQRQRRQASRPVVGMARLSGLGLRGRALWVLGPEVI